MRRWLEIRGIQLTKSLGQNFLHDANQLARIADAAQVAPGDPVLEIGPGLGPLTEALLARGARVRAVEIDARLVAVLRERFAAEANLELVHADALKMLRSTPWDFSEWKLVSNLPYSTGSPMLVELAIGRHSPRTITATLQLEVAQRLTSVPGSKSYGLLSLLTGLRYECAGSFRIPAGCFFPPPDVTSACVSLRRRALPLMPREVEATFLRVVKRAFSQRRKMMKNLLKTDWPEAPLEAAFASVSIPAKARAEEVSIHSFAQLSQHLHPFSTHA